MTITQTVEIPADHRLFIDVPREIPEGPVVLAFTPAKKLTDQRPTDRSPAAALSADGEATSPVDALFGILSGMGDITLEQIRDERLAKHTKHLK